MILGAGGHAAVVIEAITRSRVCCPYAVLDSDSRKWGSEVFGVVVRGGDDLLPKLVQEGVSHFIVGLGAVGDTRPRQLLFERARDAGLAPISIVHPAAAVSLGVDIGGGCVLLAGAVVNACTTIGDNVIVNTGAIVEHHCVIGNHVHVSTGALLGGSVRIGDGAHIGIGASIRQGINIGEHAIVGAGSVVVKDVPAGCTVTGNPAGTRSDL